MASPNSKVFSKPPVFGDIVLVPKLKSGKRQRDMREGQENVKKKLKMAPNKKAETVGEVSDSDDDWASDSSEVSSVQIFEPRSNDVLESLETDLNQVLYSTSSLPSALVKSPNAASMAYDDSDSDVEILEEKNVKGGEVLEPVAVNGLGRFIRNPLYSGTPSRSSSALSGESITILEDQTKNVNMNMKEAYIKLERLSPRKLSRSCEVDYISGIVKKEQKRVRVDVAGPRSFLVPHRQARTRPSPNSAVFSDVKVFDEKGVFCSLQEIQTKTMYFCGSVGENFYPKVGPIERYEKKYNKLTCKQICTLLHVEDNVYSVEVGSFSTKYLNFLSWNISIDTSFFCKSSKTASLDLPKKIKQNSSSGPKKQISVKTVLTSLGLTEKDGAALADAVPAVKEFKDTNTLSMIAAFLKFLVERQIRWEYRREGKEDPGTDPIFKHHKFTNLARELDRGTQFLREQILPLLLASKPRSEALSSVLFKSITYRLMNKVETFIRCPVGIPDLAKADEFLEFVKNEMDNGFPVFTSVHQNMGWERYMQTVCFCQKNILKLCDQLRSSSVLEECFAVIKSIPNVGSFFAWQILCDLTEASVITVNSLDDWAELGPGACKGLMYIFKCSSSEQFSLLKKLTVIIKQADSKYSSLSIPPPLKINCKLVEHALCEFSKYCRFANEVPKKKFTSRAWLDDSKKCEICHEVARYGNLVSSNLLCILCNRKFHTECLEVKIQCPVQFCCTDCEVLRNDC
ncbi:uncharacterized protein LOC111713446 isoform X2 [Eurytemora carolleeae]|uniref:uncharacterized protein LOC111713446 isoform X2 n=1 Tax=Eurytemora carolleeae TaxID=1294199 RepID=UPI000C782DDB|nr:uncharacterized protein LOC111713446 isoform X2 [Eurytemora carolleeae]|eukprot:XP_023344067.1 uncharacterized protein LOC111713446 isoform X2 [Eurytemora affinis]